MDSSAPRYHERQSKQMCLKHTLNNLFQEPAVTSATLDGLADHLATPSWGFSPHRTAFLGNYDINVLELALQERGKMLQWVSPPKADEAGSGWPEAALLERPDLFALVLNVVPSPAQSSGAAAWGLASLARRLGLAGRHWLGFRRFGGQWYNLDSHLPAPQLVGNDAALRDVLQHSYHCGDCGVGPAGGGRANACERPQLLAVLDAAPGQ